MKPKKLYNIITERYSNDIIFGILSGMGLVFAVSSLMAIILEYDSNLQYSIPIIYSVIYLFLVIPTFMMVAKGWFRIFYLASSLILSIVYLYGKITGVIA